MTFNFDLSGGCQLRLASYNIRKAVGLDYRRDPMRIFRVLNELNADIVAIQEVDKRLGDRPAVLDPLRVRAETDLTPAKVSANNVSVGWHGNAVLVRKGIEVCGIERLLLPGLEPRGAVKVRLKTPCGEVGIVATHLGLLRLHRRRQLSRICDGLSDGQKASTIILGDFNEWHQTRGLEPLRGDFQVLRPGSSFHSAWPLMGLDRIAVGARFKVGELAVHKTKDTKVASDHLPISADLTLRPDLHGHCEPI